MYKSGLERNIADQLAAAEIKFKYEPYKIPYTIAHTYTPDFVLASGLVIETKGFFRTGDTRKMRAVKEARPDLDIRFVFTDADKKISKGKITHGEWAIKYGFPYSTGRIPTEWLTS